MTSEQYLKQREEQQQVSTDSQIDLHTFMNEQVIGQRFVGMAHKVIQHPLASELAKQTGMPASAFSFLETILYFDNNVCHVTRVDGVFQHAGQGFAQTMPTDEHYQHEQPAS